jgi:hypothetical protein
MSIIIMLAMIADGVPQSQAGVALWRNLEVGDTVETAKSKLEAMPEIGRVKILKKRGVKQLDIKMKDGGVPVFEGHFSVSTQFRDGALSMVRLESGAGCLNDSYPFAQKINEELAKKYSITALSFADRSDFMMRALDSTESRPTKVSSGYLSDSVAVLFDATFVQHDPPTYYGGGAFARALYDLASTSYDDAAQQCGGAFYRTAQIAVTYLSRQDWDALAREVEAEAKAERRQAGDNL